MARSPITASKEGEATSAAHAEETLHFDDDNLRGEEQHAIFQLCPDVRVIILSLSHFIQYS